MTLLQIDWTHVWMAPWTDSFSIYGWIMLMGMLSTFACAMIGNFLIWRNMALVGDAISHSIVPGIVIAFLITHSRSTFPLFLGAVGAGLLTTFLVETIHRQSKIQADAALGIVFSTLFAIGIILITLFADYIDLDTDCVLFGDIAYIPLSKKMALMPGVKIPLPIIRMAIVSLCVLALLIIFYKELMITSFDPILAKSLGLPVRRIHYGLMMVLSFVIVSAFEAIGAILVVALLIFPGATAMLLAKRMSHILSISTGLSVLYPILGTHLALLFDCSLSGSIVVMAAGIFALIWLIHPQYSLVRLITSMGPSRPHS